MIPTSYSGLHLRGLLRRGDFSVAVDFHVAPGEIVALSGPNGVGKTSVLRFLAGLGGTLERDRSQSTAPVFTLDGVDQRPLAPDRRGLSVVFQEPRLVPHMTAEQNVSLAATLAGVSRTEAARRAAKLLVELGLAEPKRVIKPPKLSGGQRGRVAIARALAVPSPRLRLLDEPLAAIDAPSRAGLRDCIARHLAASNAPTILVTHDPSDVAAIADRDIPLG